MPRPHGPSTAGCSLCVVSAPGDRRRTLVRGLPEPSATFSPVCRYYSMRPTIISTFGRLSTPARRWRPSLVLYHTAVRGSDG